MKNEILNIFLAFAEGLFLIASPCILPILPLMLSASIDGSRKRPIGITLGFVFTFALFTFFSRKLVLYSGIDLNIVRDISFVFLILFGIIMMSSKLTELFGFATRGFARVGSSTKSVSQESFSSGLLFGALVAIIWTPCAGPLLAAVIVQTVLQKENLDSFIIVLAFGIGAGVPMLLIAVFGRLMINKLTFFKKHTALLRKALGLIIIISVIAMIFSQGSVANTFSFKKNSADVFQTSLISPLASPYPAPEIAGITAWINSPPLKITDLKNKVVLIDFWTYSCINCLRTLPYLKSWYDKYHDKGLVIIGVHTPEFDFEKDVNNVKAAVLKDGIKYPVALDSNFGTWQSFNNQYWPAHYLIDKSGNVVYQHFGEGEYDVTENNIRFLLGLNQITAESPHTENLGDVFNMLTPETYLGYARADHYASPENLVKDAIGTYTYPEVLNDKGWALKGKWNVSSQRISTAEKGAAIKIHFHAKDVYVILGTSNEQPTSVKLLLNGESVVNDKGKDVTDSMIHVTNHALYHAISFKNSSSGILEIIGNSAGLEVYTFTFG